MVRPTRARGAPAVGIYRILDGEIAEIRLEEDRLGLLEQLKVVERPTHLRV